MRGKQRREEILRRIQRHGYVGATQLSEELGVDPSTIRRDLAVLSRMGLVARSHGGAAVRPEHGDLTYDVKSEKHVEQKRAVAKAAAALVRDGQSVAIDSGSTMLEVARALRGRAHLTVVTDDLRVGAELAGHGDVRLIVTGGEVMPGYYTLIGDNAGAAFRQYHVDIAFLGIDAVDPGGLMLVNGFEAPMKRAMIECADRVVVVADSSKMGRRALVRAANLDEVDLVITDDGFVDDAGEYPVEILRAPLTTSVPQIA